VLLANKIEPTEGTTSRVYRLSREQDGGAPEYRIDGHLDLPTAYQYAPALGDLTDNGAADLLLGTWRKEGVAFYRNDGSGSFSRADELIVERSGDRHMTPTLGDLTGNGRLDLVLGAADGSLYYYENTGSASDPSFEHVPDVLGDISLGSRSAPALHDVDGDGTLDLVVGTEEDLVVLRNTGTPTDPSFAQAPTSVSVDGMLSLAHPAVGDLSGNGRSDVILGTERGGLVLLQAGTQP
jgi:hypothetical protein